MDIRERFVKMRDFMEAKKRFLWNVLYMYILIEWCREIRVILSRYWCVEENWRILFLLDLSGMIDVEWNNRIAILESFVESDLGIS